MIRSKKKSKSSTMGALFFIVVIAIGCFATACQKTPDAPIVREKNEEGIINAIENSEDRNIQSENPTTTYQYNPTWQETIEGESNKLSVTISADVIVTNDGEMPIASIYPSYINEEIAAKMMNVLGQGNAFYPMSKIRTKDDLMTEILELKEWLANPSGDLYESRAQYLERWNKFVIDKQDRINQLEIEWQHAPDTIENKQLEAVYHSSSSGVDMALVCDDIENQLNEATDKDEKEELEMMLSEMQMVVDGNDNVFQISGTADIGKDDAARITITKNIDSPEYNAVSFTGLYDNETIFPLPFEETYNQALHKNFGDVNGLSMEYDDALEIAKATIADIGVENMLLADAQIIGKADPMAYIYDWKDAYRFVFTRQVENVQITHDVTNIEYAEAYDNIWRNEYIEICIDDTGIVKFTWIAPAEVKEVLATNVQLLSFEEIQNIFREYIYIKGAYDEDKNIISRDTIITEVRLGLMQVQSNQSDTGYLLVPVWDFYGYDVNTYNGNTQLKLDESNQLTVVNYNLSYLTINAIDGSIIDRSIGY